ncbi:probable leucine-rich repeat receptor-like protein kinase At2g33170 [Durio zibethinus]|uniref:Probable leucine-rich repeat receptor-like protein kinase At2g33170 n=1 Tax=Durio zibethinus TaxID=66656 RepID=A0A6P6AHM8_DURZI|nr:probable leucine-rich repeat receptor-like protein kinase At2g33170 [Durio zibethinus]
MAAATKLFLGLFIAVTLNISFCNGKSNGSCIETERQALLMFKHDLIDTSNRLISWADGGDCCKWLGVVCDNMTGHVGGLHLRNPPLSGFASDSEDQAYDNSKLGGEPSSSLLNLKYLVYLDLSDNMFEGHIPYFLGSMQSLRYLNLSNAGFDGMIPYQLGNLSNLHHLSLQGYGLYVENLQWLSGLSRLQHLDLSFVDLSKASNWIQEINTFRSLVELSLSFCGLYHFPPLANVNLSSLDVLDLSWNHFDNYSVGRWIFHLRTLTHLNLQGSNLQGPVDGVGNLTSLRHLDLAYNQLNSSLPLWLYRMSHLQVLNLCSCNLHGTISSAIANLSSVITLDLSFNELDGRIEPSFGNLCNLKSISLTGTKLNQDISTILKILSGCISDRLEELFLGNCHLFGPLANKLGKFKKLAVLTLWGNTISGMIPMSLGEMSSLKMLYLFDNKLNETIPTSFGQLANLEDAEIYNNFLKGVFSEVHFANLTRLRTFNAYGNSLRLKVKRGWVPPFQIEALGLASWHLGPGFPSWLHSQKSLRYLDISNSGIADTIPTWFWNISFQLTILNLSHNQIHGKIPSMNMNSYSIIDLSSNYFKGSLPRVSSTVAALDLSNNSFLGSIFDFLCDGMNETSQMEVLNFGGNFLSGNIPNCWENWQSLIAIKLDNNNFTGVIPNSIGSLSSLQSLHLRNNKLFGELPLSLRNCTKLVTIDISENEFVGKIPLWFGIRLPGLFILSLHSNRFHGAIPEELCALGSLQILDLADNNLSGTIPWCIGNFTAMAKKNDDSAAVSYKTSGGSFVDDALLIMKGRLVAYSTILRLVRSMDLSRNALSGEIPKQVTSLFQLQSLNLSYNSLTGKIPEDIGALRLLESLDFSKNKLSGEIPQSIASLSFLSHLNLSCNNLTGRIPLSTQLQSLNASSFIGNKLCGAPLNESCDSDGSDVVNGGGKSNVTLEIDWIYFFVSMALGFVVGFWAVSGPVLFSRTWRIKYFQLLNRISSKFWIKCC